MVLSRETVAALFGTFVIAAVLTTAVCMIFMSARQGTWRPESGRLFGILGPHRPRQHRRRDLPADPARRQAQSLAPAEVPSSDATLPDVLAEPAPFEPAPAEPGLPAAVGGADGSGLTAAEPAPSHGDPAPGRPLGYQLVTAYRRQDGHPAADDSPAARLPWRLPADPSPPGITADAARIGSLEVRAASLIGPGHRAEDPGLPRQDAYRIGTDPGRKYLLVAVADGMTDSSHSQLGATVAVQTLVSGMRAALAEQPSAGRLDPRDLFVQASGRMARTAEQRGLTAADVRAAAMAAVIPVDSDRDGSDEAWFAWVADVTAWRLAAGDWVPLAGEHPADADSNVLSEFLPYHPHQVRSAFIPLRPRDVIAVGTDGLARAFTPGSVIGAHLAGQWHSPPDIVSFISDVNYQARSQVDDRTAVVAWRGRQGADA